MKHSPPRLLILGAHPDDAEFHAGGLSTRYRELGYSVKWISATHGGTGHHRCEPDTLIQRRQAEALEAASLIGAECEVWSFPDGALQPDLELRHAVIRAIRLYEPDLVLTHRPWDYHPDHRALGQAVQDACYLVTVPLVLPEVPPLNRDPVVGSMVDLFQRPIPFRPDFVLDVSVEFEAVLQMLACHESQVFEFLPVSFGSHAPVPLESTERLDWLQTWFLSHTERRKAVFQEALAGRADSRLIELFEISEYAAQLPRCDLLRLFPGDFPAASDSGNNT